MISQVQGLTNSASQTISLVLADGTVAQMTLSFRPQQLGWFYDLSYNGNNSSFQANGRRIVTSPNFIRQFRNLVPFGLAVSYVNNAEPMFQDDWINGNATMYLLDAAEVATVESLVFVGGR